MKLIDFEKYNRLSVLKNAKEGMITYYTGKNLIDISHLKNCLLICSENFKPEIDTIEVINVKNPQLYFYKLSDKFKKDYLDKNELLKNIEFNFFYHKNFEYSKNVEIYPNCTIGDCIIGKNTKIHPNCTIYSESIIGSNVVIESNTTIGAEGVMWVRDGDEKIKLHQLGNTIIEDNVFIGSNVTIVRGSANESTIIGNGTFIAHGTKIGHGCNIAKNNHFANNVSIAGSVVIGEDCFFGSGSVVIPNVKINHKIVLGAGSTLTKNTLEDGVYIGSPAKKIKDLGNSKGVPLFN